MFHSVQAKILLHATDQLRYLNESIDWIKAWPLILSEFIVSEEGIEVKPETFNAYFIDACSLG